ncbi:MAG: GIY-YIG nuclease family protein [Candidatus Magasanikbacteria bacterium]|nr:GIY-YIG nuclease family protein [Candidatus Magasanikbacteria bacterium]
MIDDYYIYIMTNRKNGVLYAGVTNNLRRRVWEHKEKIKKGTFTCKYNLDQLVYFEIYNDPENAIIREKQIKGGSRQDKINLIEKDNPEWRDLSDDF